MKNTLLEIRNLNIHYQLDDTNVYVVNNLNFKIKRNEIVALIGESGCGKSTTALSLMQLLPEANSCVDGEILFEKENLLELNKKRIEKIRGRKLSMIYQEPMNSLNPILPIGYQIEECLKIHKIAKGKEAKKKTIEMLNLVGIPDPEQRYKAYPHEFSGGMQQRVMIAMALITEPTLLIADEPTTALDVTIQAEILDLIKKLKQKLKISVLLITHDLGVVSDIADRILVMYCGEIVEYSTVKSIFKEAYHPYTKGLLECIPRLNENKEHLHTIQGSVPDLTKIVDGCPFYDRCNKKLEQCANEKPKPVVMGEEHIVRCWLYE